MGNSISDGFCHCGCGEPTTLISKTDKSKGRVLGQYPKFVVGHGNTKSLEDRFWEKVQKLDDDSCWPWLGATNQKGYGSVWIRELCTRVSSNRASFFLSHGFWPTVARHTCDNPICCNPRHIIDGSVMDNIQDRTDRGRHFQPKGELNNMSRLNEHDVHLIRQLVCFGQSQASVSRQFGVSRTTICDIVHRRTWSHL